MAVLTHPVGWRRKAKRDVDSALTPEEQTNVRVAILFLVKRYGMWAKLAAAMRSKTPTVRYAVRAGNTVSATVALRAARVARVQLEDILAGRWPTPTMCPYCGRE